MPLCMSPPSSFLRSIPTSPRPRLTRDQHARSLQLPFPPSVAVCAASSSPTSAARRAWRLPRPSREIRPSRRSSLLPCHRTHPPVRQGPSQASMLPYISPLPLSLEASQHRPARASNATSQSLRVSRMSPARAQPTHSLRIHRAHCLLAAAPTPSPPPPTPAPRVDRGHARLCPRVGGVRACTLPLATCPSQPGGKRLRRRHQTGPQSRRRHRPRASTVYLFSIES